MSKLTQMLDRPYYRELRAKRSGISYFEAVKGIYAYKTVKRTTSSHPSIEDHELVLQALREARQVSGGGSPDPE